MNKRLAVSTLLPFLLLLDPRLARPDEFHVVQWQRVKLSNEFLSEGATSGDFNRDGKLDIVAGPYWYAGPDFQERHAYYEPKPFDPARYSDNFFAYSEDFNRDGWSDILIIGFPGQDASWFENPKGQDRYWPRHKVVESVDNESPTFIDITGDGQREIVCSVGGYFGYAEVNSEDAALPWRFHPISDQTGGGRFTHGLGVGDVDGDGRMDILEKSGWWQQPHPREKEGAWTKHPFAFSGPGGAQMYAYDVDGDGDNDVITSLAAHGFGLAWYEQIKNGKSITFQRHAIMGDNVSDSRYGVRFAELHAIDLADIDGDGVQDIVTGKRWWSHGAKGDPDPETPPVVYWFRTIRGGTSGQAEFVPHLIDDDSGVGVEVKTRDVNGDALPDIIIGSKRGAFVHLQSRRKVGEQRFRAAQPLAIDDIARPKTDGLPDNAGLKPEEAAAAITLPKGFQAQLIAGEPQVHQPIAFTIDQRGRLWIAEAHTYPQRAPAGEGKDRIIILADEDSNGTFESRKVFCENLNLVSGLEVGFGGAWVGAAPYLMFIPDRDGDDRPDGKPEILLDGFGFQDTHETLNSFIWGPDGWLYGCHGVFTHSRVGKAGTPDDQRTPLNAGVWRYHPTRHAFEIFAWGTSNPWGVDFDDRGQAFITACVIPHLYHMIQGGRYQRQGGQHFSRYVYDDIKTIARHRHYAGNIRDHAWWGRNEPVANIDTNKAGGGHAHCGAMIYLGDNWPVWCRNQMFMNNVHGNRVNMDALRRSGSGYTGGRMPDFLFANDRWYRGISLKYGPDGGVYLIDWYDKNACHRNQPEIWDRSNGRVFKVTYGDVPAQEVDIAKLRSDELVALQLRANDWYVRTARRILQQRAAAGEDLKNVRNALAEIARNNSDDTRQLRALWALHVTGGVDAKLASDLLAAEQEYVRAWTIQLLLEDGEIDDATLELLVEMSRADNSPVVRLYLASALQRLPIESRWGIAAGLLAQGEDAMDHNLPLLVWYGVEPLVTADPPRALELAGNTRIPIVRRFIYRRAAADEQALPQLLSSLGKQSDVASQQAMLEEITAAVATRGKLAMPEGWPDVYAKLAASESETVRWHAQAITIKFGDKSIFPALRTIVADGKSNLDARRQALAALLNGKDAQLPPVLFQLLDDQALRGEALRGLARFDAGETPKEVLARYEEFDAAARSDAVTTLASRPAYASALLDAVAESRVPRGDISAFTAGQIARLEDEKVAEKLNSVWGTIRSSSEEKRRQIEQYKKLLTPAALADANISHGRQLYNKTCAKCHKLFGEGQTIGPDITGSNRANLDYLLENLLDPSAVVGRDYQMTTIVNSSGRSLSGLIEEENDSAVALRTQNELIVIDKDDIDERRLSPLSMMPEGQLQELEPADARDLVAYLRSGSQVPLPGEGPFLDPKTGLVAGAMEGETMKVLEVTAGAARSQKMHPFPKDRWSGTDHLWWTGGRPGDRLMLSFHVPADGKYELFTVLTKARDYGIVQLSIDEAKAAPPIDLFNSPDVITTGVVSLGTHELKAGAHRLGIKITGAHPEAVKAYMFGLDYLYLAERK